MSIVNMAVYNCTLIVWLGYVALKSPVRDANTPLQTQRWEQSLSDIHHPLPADSLIPMFEGMVDRALSRTQPEASVQPDGKRAAAAAASGFPASVRAGSKT